MFYLIGGPKRCKESGTGKRAKQTADPKVFPMFKTPIKNFLSKDELINNFEVKDLATFFKDQKGAHFPLETGSLIGVYEYPPNAGADTPAMFGRPGGYKLGQLVYVVASEKHPIQWGNHVEVLKAEIAQKTLEEAKRKAAIQAERRRESTGSSGDKLFAGLCLCL